MAKKPKTEETGPEGQEPANVELFRFVTLEDRCIINGHVLPKGTVIELTEEEAANQRAGGVPLDDVHAVDRRDVHSVREPYVAVEGE